MHTSKNFEVFESMLTGLWFLKKFLSSFFYLSEVIFASLKIDGDSSWQIKLLKLEWRNSIQRSAFFLIILDGISESWQAFHASKFKTSLKISSLSTHLKANWELFLHTSPTVSILAWFLCFSFVFKVGLCMFPTSGSQLL